MRWVAALLAAAVLVHIGGASAARAADSDVTGALALIPSGALYPEGPANKPFAPGSVRAVVTSLRVGLGFMMPDGQAWQRLRSDLLPKIFFDAAGRAVFDPEPWREAVGVNLEEVTAVAAFGYGPSIGAVWVLQDESAASRLLAHLRTRGFAPGEGGWFVNGDPGKINPRLRAPADPFRGGIGESYAVRQDGRVLHQQKMSDAPPAPHLVQTLFAAARDALRDASQDVTLVQAMVVSLLMEAPDISLAEAMQPASAEKPRSQTELAKLWEAEVQRSAAAVRTAIPFTPIAVVADFEESAAARRGVIVILPYEDCDAARTANARFPALWQAAPTSIIEHLARPDAAVTTALLDQGSACTAVIRVTTQSAAGTMVNPVWRYVGSVFRERLPGPFTTAPS